MKKHFIIYKIFVLILLISKTVHAETVSFKRIYPDTNKIDTYYSNAYYPYDCDFILKIKKTFYRRGYSKYYKVENLDTFDDVVFKCKTYLTGKTVKEGVKKGVSKGVDVGKTIIDKSGVGSFIKGLLD